MYHATILESLTFVFVQIRNLLRQIFVGNFEESISKVSNVFTAKRRFNTRWQNGPARKYHSWERKSLAYRFHEITSLFPNFQLLKSVVTITRLHCMRVKSLTGRYAPFTITAHPIIGCQSQGAMVPIYIPSPYTR